MTTHQLRIPRPGSRSPARLLVPVATLPLLLISAAGVGVIAVSHPDGYRLALAVALAANLIIAAMKWPRAAALATLFFLPFLALVRRLLIADTGFTSNDPLLLVGPVVALFLIYRLYLMQRRRSFDRLSKVVLALLVVTVIQVFNPFATGGIVTAAGGLLFVAVPLLWFFIGRELGDRTSVTYLLYGTILVACLVGIYGLLQTQFGTIPSWDQAWLDINSYAGLLVGDSGTNNTIRPFSTFSSNQEYALFMGIGVTFVVAFLLQSRFSVAVVLPLLVLALFLAGGRGALVTSALAVTILLALMTRRWLSGILIVALGIAVAYGAAATFGPRIDRAAGLGGNAVVERNVTGILKPLDPAKSTVIGHWNLILIGIEEGIRHPAGHGTGASTLATQLTDTASRDSENDIANAFVNLGIVGGGLYLVIIAMLFRARVRPLCPTPRRSLVRGRGLARRDIRPMAERRPVRGRAAVLVPRWLGGADRPRDRRRRLPRRYPAVSVTKSVRPTAGSAAHSRLPAGARRHSTLAASVRIARVASRRSRCDPPASASRHMGCRQRA